MSASLALPAPPPLLRDHVPLWLVITMACLASFMVVMDGSIVNVALPAMQQALSLSPAQLSWVVDAYLLSFGGSMLLAARAGDLYGRRPVLQLGLGLFTAASLVAGLAGNAAWVLAARAAQGLGAAVLATSSMTLVMAATHADKQARAKAMSLWAALNSAGFAFGVVIGGLLTDAFGWRWVMFVNVPVGLALMAGVSACLLPPVPRSTAARLDLPGAASVTLGSTALIYGITRVAELGWASPQVLVPLGTALVLLALFINIERRSAQPLVRLSIFHLPQLRTGNLLMLCLGATLTASVFLLSTALQQLAGYSARDTGLALLPMGVVLAASRLVFAKADSKAAVRWLPPAGALLAAIGLGWLGLMPAQADFLRDVLAPTLLLGTGIGIVILRTTQAVTSGVPVQDAGLASGLANTARQLGGALGVALVASLAAAVAHGELASAGAASAAAMMSGLHAAFFAAAALSGLCALIALALRSADGA